ncbi:MAG: VOC family protein [Longimicrobiales bacterium]|nr:VOC family protein [Longimicrobiales bacterium]
MREQTVEQLRAVHPVLMVRDVDASVRFFRSLGFECGFTDSGDPPRYAGVVRDGVEIHLQWHEPSQWDHDGDLPTYRFLVEDVDGLYQEFRGVGHVSTSEVFGAPADTPWGTREFHLRDPDGNGLHFYRDLDRARSPR